MLLAEHKWYRLNATNVDRLPDVAGAYELSGAGAVVLYIGWAEVAGLREAVRAHIKDPRNPCIASNAFFFRFEVSSEPAARAAEILAAYRAARYGTMPECM
jgi:hypothetical protein